MLWWVGGNPFHHAQDLNRLRQAFQRPETIIVNDINWASTTRHADIVLPVAAAQVRLDFVAGKYNDALIPMPRLASPPADVLTEFEIYALLEARLFDATPFIEGFSADQWVQRLWQETVETAHRHGDSLPQWDEFIEGGIIALQDPEPEQNFLADFRSDPQANPSPTPSGKIELFSETVSNFDYDDCPGHATWFQARGITNGQSTRFRLQMLSGQPATRLHSRH